MPFNLLTRSRFFFTGEQTVIRISILPKSCSGVFCCQCLKQNKTKQKSLGVEHRPARKCQNRIDDVMGEAEVFTSKPLYLSFLPSMSCFVPFVPHISNSKWPEHVLHHRNSSSCTALSNRATGRSLSSEKHDGWTFQLFSSLLNANGRASSPGFLVTEAGGFWVWA